VLPAHFLESGLAFVAGCTLHVAGCWLADIGWTWFDSLGLTWTHLDWLDFIFTIYDIRFTRGSARESRLRGWRLGVDSSGPDFTGQFFKK